MKRLLLALLGAGLILALVPTALAKGPSEASIDGPGLASPIELVAAGERAMAEGAPMMEFAAAAGFFPAVFPRQPNPMLPRRPEGELGPRYVVDYVVPGPYGEEWRILQDLYPYAKPGPVTYMAPGQPIYQTQTRGGWFASTASSGPSLMSLLTDAGLPRTPPGTGDGSPFPWTLAGVLLSTMLAAGAAALLLTRRRRPRNLGSEGGVAPSTSIPGGSR